MERGDKFRVVVPTLGILEKYVDRIPVTLTPGKILTVVVSTPDAEGLIGIRCDGELMAMYSHDLEERCEIVRMADAG